MRFLCFLALLAPLACAQSGDPAADGAPTDRTPRSAAAPPAETPATVGEAAVTPAAPPVSNMDRVVDEDDASEAVAPDPETAERFASILADAAAQGVAERPYGEIVQWTGEQLVGVPYVAGMLDAPETETLVVSLTGFDCVLYIENVLALSRMIALGETGYADYAAHVRDLRYRGQGAPTYCSRLHYFTDWIATNEAAGRLTDVTALAGGEPFDKTLDFMSTHRDAYRQLADDSAYACIQDRETELRGVDLVYIPQARIAGSYDALQPGDIIATATSIGGLDVTHTGFVHQTEGGTGFMHASLSSNAVKVSPDLEEYVQGIKSQVGVIVARPVDPRQ